MKRNTMQAIILFICLLVAFFAGVQWEKFQYTDICLDMGGGVNPVGYPICVVENNQQTDVYQGDVNQGMELHPSWDINNDGRNDCEDDGICDDSVDYSKPRNSVLGLDCSNGKNDIVFDKQSGKWIDCYGICHTCTPENGFNPDGTQVE